MYGGEEMSTRRSKFDASLEKHCALVESEALGMVADSMDVRMDLVTRMNAGEFDLAECQRRLKEIKRNAKKNGLLTRSQVWSRS
jgi:hypothetical protein